MKTFIVVQNRAISRTDVKYFRVKAEDEDTAIQQVNDGKVLSYKTEFIYHSEHGLTDYCGTYDEAEGPE